MHPVPAAELWTLPAIETSSALADWLGLSTDELDWFADLKGLQNKTRCPKLTHYRYKLFVKHSGSVRPIEAPKPRMKALQRQILVGILENVPPHDAAHGFVKGRSIKTFATPHAGQRVVLRMDVQDFFPNIPTARIQTLFRTIGYPDKVADLLGGICTNIAPKDIWAPIARDFLPIDTLEAKSLYTRSHLPQGAPTSPTLANLCAYRLDCRLTGFARAAEAQYTRYADDLAFSGGSFFEQRVQRFATHVAAILLEEGFSAHHRKTRIMRQGVSSTLPVSLPTKALISCDRTSIDSKPLSEIAFTSDRPARTVTATQIFDPTWRGVSALWI